MDPSVQIREQGFRGDGFFDADWAGDKETRKSSSAVVALVGRHHLQAYTRTQKIIASSSAEAELYAAALGASRA